MALTDIYDALEILLEGGTWTNYHATTPTIWQFNLKDMANMRDWAMSQKEGIVIQKMRASSMNVADGSLFGENQRASILGFSSTDSGIMDDLLEDLISILEGEGYVFITKEIHDMPRLHYFILRVRRIEIN
jgi:hypothetical protein